MTEAIQAMARLLGDDGSLLLHLAPPVQGSGQVTRTGAVGGRKLTVVKNRAPGSLLVQVFAESINRLPNYSMTCLIVIKTTSQQLEAAGLRVQWRPGLTEQATADLVLVATVDQ